VTTETPAAVGPVDDVEHDDARPLEPPDTAESEVDRSTQDPRLDLLPDQECARASQSLHIAPPRPAGRSCGRLSPGGVTEVVDRNACQGMGSIPTGVHVQE
jgi:hypothetical protein